MHKCKNKIHISYKNRALWKASRMEPSQRKTFPRAGAMAEKAYLLGSTNPHSDGILSRPILADLIGQLETTGERWSLVM